MKKIILLSLIISSFSYGYGESAGDKNREYLGIAVGAGLIAWGVVALTNNDAEKSDFTSLTHEDFLKKIELGQSFDVYRLNDNFTITTGDKFNFKNSYHFHDNNEIAIGLKFSF